MERKRESESAQSREAALGEGIGTRTRAHGCTAGFETIPCERRVRLAPLLLLQHQALMSMCNFLRVRYQMPLTAVVPFGLMMVLMTTGSGGAPLTSPPDTICLQDYTKERFHRLIIVCRDLTAILREDGHFIGCNASYDDVCRCVTWRDGILSDCVVTEIDENGRRTDLPITYMPTSVFHASTIKNPTPGNLTLTERPPVARHRWIIIAAAVATFICFLHFLLAFLWEMYPEDARDVTALSLVWARPSHWF